jgi:non-heme chloroperoxidase
MRSQDAQENVALVGFSMGGGEIARYMSRHGGRGVSQVALVSSVVPYMVQTEDNPHGVPAATLQQIGDDIRRDRAHFMRGFFKDFFGAGLIASPVSSETLDLAWNTAMQAGLHPTLAAAQAFGSTDFRPDLASFTVPTLVIHGTADKTVPIDATGRAVAGAVSQATLIEYDGEPHGVFATQTDRLIRDLQEFLGGPGSVFRDIDEADPQDRQALLDELTFESLATPRI